MTKFLSRDLSHHELRLFSDEITHVVLLQIVFHKPHMSAMCLDDHVMPMHLF